MGIVRAVISILVVASSLSAAPARADSTRRTTAVVPHQYGASHHDYHGANGAYGPSHNNYHGTLKQSAVPDDYRSGSANNYGGDNQQYMTAAPY